MQRKMDMKCSEYLDEGRLGHTKKDSYSKPEGLHFFLQKM